MGLARGATQTVTGTGAYANVALATLGIGSNGVNTAGFGATNGYISGLADTISNLTHLGARDLDPVTGTFTSTDPILDKANPNNYSPYQYANADPTNYSDPSGLFVDGCVVLCPAGAGAVGGVAATIGGLGIFGGAALGLYGLTQIKVPSGSGAWGGSSASGGICNAYVAGGCINSLLATFNGQMSYFNERMDNLSRSMAALMASISSINFQTGATPFAFLGQQFWSASCATSYVNSWGMSGGGGSSTPPPNLAALNAAMRAASQSVVDKTGAENLAAKAGGAAGGGGGVPPVKTGMGDAADDDDWAFISGILRAAARGKGNFGLGSATESQAMEVGRAWVGAGYRLSSNGLAMVSRDGMRSFRPPSWKGRLGKFQANFLSRTEGQLLRRAFGNGHLDITGID